jgi:phage repressor protein C with HTH and peptisase S24 domain
MKSIKERVLKIAEFKGIPKDKFTTDIGMSYGSFKGSAKDRPLNSNAIEKILTIVPEINPEWLLTGRGSMTKTAENDPNVKVFEQKTDRLIEKQEIPLYDMEATAGIIDQLNNDVKNIPIDTIRIPNMPKADGAVYVTGDSMYPLLKSGDIVIFKRIQDIPNDIFWGEMYIVSMHIAGEEYVTVKYVQKSDKGDDFIKLVSLNQHHQPKDIPLAKVRAMALVKASIRFNTMN